MSNFDEHLKKGALISSALVTVVIFAASQYFLEDIPISLTLAICVLLGSLAPDLDHTSTPSKWTARVLFTLSILAILKEQYPNSFDSVKSIQWLFSIKFALYADVIFIAFKSCKHRGLSHKYIFPAGLCALGYFIDNPWLYAFSIGLVVHYLVDKIYPWRLNHIL